MCFRTIHLDIVDPLRDSHGYKDYLRIIDRFTRQPEVISLKNITKQISSEALCHNRQGMQVESILSSDLGKLLRFKRQWTIAYRPESKGMLQRWYRKLKAVIMAQQQVFLFILLGLCTGVRKEFAANPADPRWPAMADCCACYGSEFEVYSNVTVS